MNIVEILSGVENLHGKKKGERRKMANAVVSIAEINGAEASSMAGVDGEILVNIKHPSGLCTSCHIGKPTRANRAEFELMSWATRRDDGAHVNLSPKFASSIRCGFAGGKGSVPIDGGFVAWCRELARGLAMAERGLAYD